LILFNNNKELKYIVIKVIEKKRKLFNPSYLLAILILVKVG